MREPDERVGEFRPTKPGEREGNGGGLGEDGWRDRDDEPLRRVRGGRLEAAASARRSPAAGRRGGSYYRIGAWGAGLRVTVRGRVAGSHWWTP